VRLDAFVVAIALAVVLASVLPARGDLAEVLSALAAIGIAVLFFLHGARLPREAIARAFGHWRLHLIVLATTFVLFPLLGLALAAIFDGVMAEPLTTGLVFLGCVPSTVQSSIAFTSIARGNVAAAVSAAALSNVLGVVLTPLLVALLVSREVGDGGGPATGGGAGDTIRGVALQLLLPFVLGQLARPWLIGWLERNRSILGWVDRGSILLVVYVAFSAAVVRGLWQTVSGGELALLVVVDAGLLALVLALTRAASRVAKLTREDEIAVVFCGSKKSLATGVPMAGLIFPEAIAGRVLLPLMVFHQIQLMVVAVIAQRWSRRRQGQW